MRVGAGFAKECDLYRAITAYKRALILLPNTEGARRLEIIYQIAHCYYLGGKFEEAIATIEESPLCYVGPDFPAYHELLLLLRDSYCKTGQTEKGEYVGAYLGQVAPERAHTLDLGLAIERGDIGALRASDLPAARDLAASYCALRKSPGKAQILNASLPGAGFWYIGQRQTAITALLVNALFIIGTWQLFDRGHFALGAVTASLEAGWYFGGIYGAREEAERYNNRLYKRLASPLLSQNRLHPCLQLRWGF